VAIDNGGFEANSSLR